MLSDEVALNAITDSRLFYQTVDLVHGEKNIYLQYSVNDRHIETANEVFGDTDYIVDYTDQYTGEGRTTLVIGRDETIVSRIWQAIEDNDFWTVGELLGYPECCIESYMSGDGNGGPKMDCNDTVTELATYPSATNVLLEVWHLSHFLCSYDCSESVTIGNRRLDLAEQIQPERVATDRRKLASFVVHHDEHGACYATDYTLDGAEVTHHGFELAPGVSTQPFHDALNATESLTVHDPHSFTVDGETYDDPAFTLIFFE